MRTRGKKFIATMLVAVLLLQTFSALSVTSSAQTEDTTVQGVLNGEGLWLTEIYAYDEVRETDPSVSRNFFDSITTFTASDGSSPQLMEFIELVSTHEGTIDLNDVYEITYNGTALTVTDMAGSGNIRISKGQCVVIWNYRADLGVKDADGNALSEAHFRTAMKVPEDAIVLKTECGVDWDDSSATFSVNRKSDSVPVSSYTAKASSVLVKGFSVELRVPNRGSAMAVYHKYSIPSAGSYDVSTGLNTRCQLNGLIYGQDSTGTPEGVYVTEIKAEDIDRTDVYGTAAGQDLMEYIEITNTTSETVDLNTEYRVKYFVRETYRENLVLYNSTDLTSTEGCTVAPGGTAILWCYRKNASAVADATSFPTEQDFRDTYGIADDVPVYFFEIKSSGNDLQDNKRGIEVYRINDDGSHTLVSGFGYNDSDAAETGINAIHLKPNHGRGQMLLFSSYSTTPGWFKTNQMVFDDDGTKLLITLDDNDTDFGDTVTVPGSIVQGEELRVLFKVEPGTDNSGNKSSLTRTKTTLYYRLKTDGVWSESWEEKEELTEAGAAYLRVPGYYEAIVSAYELYNADAVQFYIKAYNKYRGTFSEVYEVDVQKLSEIDGIRTNISDGEVVSGTIAITANDGNGNSGLTVSVDGTAYGLTPMLEDGAYLTFQMSGRAKAGRHALTTADDSNTLIRTLSYWYEMVQDGQAVKLDSSLFQRNTDTDGNVTYDVTVRFWAGTPGTYLFNGSYADTVDTNYYNNIDQYEVSDLSLRVQDNVYTATTVINRIGNTVETNANGNYNIGADSAGTRTSKFARVDVSFSVPEADAPALGFELDTTKLSDGAHTLVMTSGSESRTVSFVVDNTAPVIDAKINADANLTGIIAIDPSVTDAGSADMVVVLDDQQIQTPYSISAYDLGKGEHTLEIFAADQAGNTAEEAVTFTVDYADMTAQGQTVVAWNGATLTLNVDTDSAAEAVFYKAEKVEYNSAAVTDSDVPYLKYTVSVGDVADTDEIVVNWAGAYTAQDGYAAKMYVRNTAAVVEADRWDLIATADSAGKIENIAFVAENHVDSDGQATIIVQYLRDTATPDVDGKADSMDAGQWDGGSRPEDYDFCFVLQADPQYYTERYAHLGIYSTMNQWIVDNADEWKIKYVMNVGDLIDDLDMTYQWEIADEAMSILDEAGMPYGVLAGNHDCGESLADYGNYWKCFGQDRFATQQTYGGSYQNNMGHYDLISQNGEDFVIVYMSWNVYREEIEWINQILQQYRDRKAILCFHGYTRPQVDESVNRLDYFGQLLEKTVVATNPNVIAVFNGHYYGAAYYVSQYDDNGDDINDRTVYHICRDYQSGQNGGNGYIDLLYFDIDSDKIYMNSYSPFTGEFNFFDEESTRTAISNSTGDYTQIGNCDVVMELSGDTPDGDSGDYYNALILNVDFDTVTQVVTGNEFSAYICRHEQLGTATVNDSGTAAIQADMVPGMDYGWYAVLRNEETGCLRTEVFEFATSEIDAVVFHSNIPGVNDTVFRAYTRNADLLTQDDSLLELSSTGVISSFYDIPTPPAAENTQYIFKGWYLDADNDNDTNPIKWSNVYTGSVDIYAHWIVVEDVAKENDGKDAGTTSYPGFAVLGAQVRQASGDTTTGLRFITVLSEQVYGQIHDLNSQNGTEAEYGFVLAKTTTAKSYGRSYGDDYLLQYKGTNVNGVRTTGKYSYITNVKCSNDEDLYSGEDYRLYSMAVVYGSLTGSKLTAAQNVKYVARAYIRYYDANGLLRTCYGNYTGDGALYGGCSISYTEALALGEASGNLDAAIVG